MIDRHLKPRGNILIFTIFILFASALLGILVSVMMRDFLKYSNEIAHYHQANALAKSASELGFLMIWESRAGFDFEWNGEGLIKANFSCPVEKNEKEECWLPRSFSLTIKGLKNQTSTFLKPGQSLTLPTFWHTVRDFKLDGIQVRTDIPTVVGNAPDFKYSIVEENVRGNNNWETSITNPGNNQQGADNRYYVVSNLDSENGKQLNVSSKDWAPLFDGTFNMTVEGKYGDKVVSKEYQINQSLPDFLQSDNYLTSPQSS